MKINSNIEQKLASLNERQYKCFFSNFSTISKEIIGIAQSSHLFNRSIENAFDKLKTYNEVLGDSDPLWIELNNYINIEIKSDKNIDRNGDSGLILRLAKDRGMNGFILSIENIAIQKSYTHKEFFKTSIEWLDHTHLNYYLVWPKDANGNMLFDVPKFNVDLSTGQENVKCSNIIAFLNNHDSKKYRLSVNSLEVKFIESLNSFIWTYLDNLDDIITQDEEDKTTVKQVVQNLVLSEFDKDSDGLLDIVQDDKVLLDLLRIHEKAILDFDHSIIQKIIKINKYLNQKRDDLNIIFENLRKIDNQKELEVLLPILRRSMDNYQATFIHALNMIACIKTRELVSFYEIYEGFDELGVFYSNWEIEVSDKLSTINFKLDNVVTSLRDLMHRIDSFENTIAIKFDKLTYVTGASFNTLKLSLTSELQSIRSGIGLSNLLAGINTYQLHQLNKHISR
jgi:hypothetical protein